MVLPVNQHRTNPHHTNAPWGEGLLAGRPFAQLLAAGGLVVLGVGGRYLLNGVPNVETLMVACWLAVMLLPFRRAMGLVLILYWASNWALGYQHILWKLGGIYLFTYTGFLLVGLVAGLLRRRASKNLSDFSGRSVMSTAAYGILFVAIFDTWTNFGVFWMWYAHTPTNLLWVMYLGAPFALLHLVSSISSFTLIGLPLYLLTRWAVERDSSTLDKQELPLTVDPGTAINIENHYMLDSVRGH